MSEEKPKLRPMNIKVDDDLLERLVAVGVTDLLGFKLCRLNNAYDVDAGERDISIRVCGGAMDLHCDGCHEQVIKISAEDKVTLLTSDIHREDEF